MKAVQAVWYLKEGTKQPAKRKTDFENIEKPFDIIDLVAEYNSESHKIKK